MKELCAKHAPVTVVAREIVMAHRSRYLLVRYGDHHEEMEIELRKMTSHLELLTQTFLSKFFRVTNSNL